MPNFSFFWKKHYSDIGNCCMTKPLDETTVPGTNGSRLVSYIDVTWMSDIKLKWIGWDKGGDFAWITPDGMIYRFTDLKRNERGMKYEKEVQKLELWSGGWGTDGPPENLYEWELSVQENCGFCKSTPGGKKGEKEEKEDETGEKESDKDGGVNVRDWKEFADSKPEDENNNITRTNETTNTEHVTNTGKTAYDDALENAKGGGGGKKGADDNDDEDGFIAKLPYKDLIKLPAKPEDDDEPIYRKIPQFTKPKYQNPVLDNKKVLDNQKIIDKSKILQSPFRPPQKEEPIDKLSHKFAQNSNKTDKVSFPAQPLKRDLQDLLKSKDQSRSSTKKNSDIDQKIKNEEYTNSSKDAEKRINKAIYMVKYDNRLYGSNQKNKIDCSSATREISEAVRDNAFKDIDNDNNTGRGSKQQAEHLQKYGQFTTNIHQVELGDYIFWTGSDNPKTENIDHTGIVVAIDKEGIITVASAEVAKYTGKSFKIAVLSLDGTIWRKRDGSGGKKFVGAGRP
jgi:hypothetical protein